MRMRNNKDLQFLIIPLISFIPNSPSLFPRPTIDVQKLNLVIQTLGGNIDFSLGNGDVVRVTKDGFFKLVETRLFRFEVGRDGFGDAVEDESDEEEKKRDCES